jgi:hypothetical protein
MVVGLWHLAGLSVLLVLLLGALGIAARCHRATPISQHPSGLSSLSFSVLWLFFWILPLPVIRSEHRSVKLRKPDNLTHA